ncbi:MAG: hypothetical protein GWN58_61025 [Anaerolineae bacterium]|nr:hypothetical protein [Anaerolineae bacterium]
MYKQALSLRKIQLMTLKTVVLVLLLVVVLVIGWAGRPRSSPIRKTPVAHEVLTAAEVTKQAWPTRAEVSPRLEVMKVFILGDHQPIPISSSSTRGEWPIEEDGAELARAMIDDFRPQLHLKRVFTIDGHGPLGIPVVVAGRISVWEGRERYLVLDLEVSSTWPAAYRR